MCCRVGCTTAGERASAGASDAGNAVGDTAAAPGGLAAAARALLGHHLVPPPGIGPLGANSSVNF